jgi:hypothetical protein
MSDGLSCQRMLSVSSTPPVSGSRTRRCSWGPAHRTSWPASPSAQPSAHWGVPGAAHRSPAQHRDRRRHRRVGWVGCWAEAVRLLVMLVSHERLGVLRLQGCHLTKLPLSRTAELRYCSPTLHASSLMFSTCDFRAVRRLDWCTAALQPRVAPLPPLCCHCCLHACKRGQSCSPVLQDPSDRARALLHTCDAQHRCYCWLHP